MTPVPRAAGKVLRWSLLTLVALQLVWLELAALSGQTFRQLPGAAVPVAIVFVGALWALWSIGRTRVGAVRVMLLAAAALISLRFHVVRVSNGWYASELLGQRPDAPPPAETARLKEFMRTLIAAQEQYRLHRGAYAASLDSLRPWLVDPGSVQVTIRRNAMAGWAATATSASATCSVWVRDSTLREHANVLEGAPACDRDVEPMRHQRVHSVVVEPAVEHGFRTGALTGRWQQHRGTASRAGVGEEGIADTGAADFSWSTRIGAELVASPAVAGNQVFVGGHGNGEIVALTLDSGHVGFRLRAPNWVHHDPVVSAELLIVGFGNNEVSQTNLGPGGGGSAPSGIVAYARGTGFERWRRYTDGSVMTSPVLLDSVAAVNVSAREILAVRLSDGSVMWRAPLPSSSAMGNLLHLDSLLFIGLEGTTLCALNATSGTRRYCTVLDPAGWGAGHTSLAGANGTVFMVYTTSVSLAATARAGLWGPALRSVIGVTSTTAASEQVLVAADAATGAIRWRTRLGIGINSVLGHAAGTPTINNGVVYVPSPVNGHVIAVREDDGRMLWSTSTNSARGSVLVTNGSVVVATTDSMLRVLDASSGAIRCAQRLPSVSDRAGPTVSGSTALLALRSGEVRSRPLASILRCGT